MKKALSYTLSTCPWCVKTKEFFARHHIPFEYTDYDLADAATQAQIRRELDAIGASGFPVIRIGDQVIDGYQPARIAKLLHIEGEAA